MRIRLQRLIVVSVLMMAVVSFAVAQTPKRKAPRAKPKKFSRDEVARVFFEDVSEVLVGQRPNLETAAADVASAPDASAGEASSASGSSTPSSGSGWSQHISATTIEDEIKLLKRLVDQDVSTPGEFKGRGYSECRRHFTIAAMLFGIIHEYDGDVRWKSNAAVARDLFARTAANAKVGTTQVFNEAKLRKTDLGDLINGSQLVAAKEASAENDWPNIADRGPLMQRLEMALDGGVKKFVSSESEFKSNKDKLIHEAELIAAIGAVLTKGGMEDGDDDTYAEYAQQMQSAARDVVKGAKDGEYDFSRKAAGAIDQACSVCHESYRG